MSTKTTAIEIIDTMRAQGLKLCFAEACTAGGIPKVATSIPGASDVFLGGITAYHDEAIARVLGLLPRELDHIRAVSENTTNRLARAALKQFGGDLCIATTGYLGPFEDDHPHHHEGFVVVRDVDGFSLSEKLHLEGRREANRQAMLTAAFDLALKSLRAKIERDTGRTPAAAG